MKKMTTRFLVTITLTLGSSMISLHAQNYFLSKTKLTIVGNAQIDFTSDTSQSQFGNLAFKPVFLVSLSDRLFLESELEVATQAGEGVGGGPQVAPRGQIEPGEVGGQGDAVPPSQ